MGLNWRFHWKCGRHSNIPVCCRVFWIFVWPCCYRTGNWYAQYIWTTGVNYVQCPVCLLFGRVAPLYSCDCQWGQYTPNVKG